MENVEMRTHLLPQQRRTHKKRQQTLQILGLRESRCGTILRRLDMKFMQSSDGEHRRALPREQLLGVFLVDIRFCDTEWNCIFDLPGLPQRI